VTYSVAPSDRYAVVPDSVPDADGVPQIGKVPDMVAMPGSVPDVKRQKV
jgi:hypothetical protein